MANMNILTSMKAEIEKKTADVQNIQKELSASMQTLNALQSQFTENKLVKEELDQLDDDARIYKLVGPVLIPQEPEEAKRTVSTRMSFISKELTAAREKVSKKEKLQQKKRVELLKEQQNFQALVQRTAASAAPPPS